MATNGTYVIAGVVVAASVLGFAAFKQIESAKANDTQELIVAKDSGFGASPQAEPNNDAMGIPPGGSVGEGQTEGSGAPNMNRTVPQRNNGQFGRGPGSGQGNRPQGNGQMGGGQRTPNQGNNSRPNQSGGPGGVPPMRNSGSAEDNIFAYGSMILGDDKVLTELKLDAGQKEAIAQALKPPAANSDDSQNPEAAVENMMNAGEARGKKVKAILNDAQEKRFTQLVYQSFGPSAMMQPQYMEKFGLSEDEVKKMQEAAQTFMQEQMKNMQGGNFDLEAIAKKKDELDKKMLAALDDDSRSKWKAAIGAPFKFSSPMGLGGMFGGGGGRGMGRPGGGRRPGGN